MRSEQVSFVDAEVRRRMEEDISQVEIEKRLQMIRDFGDDVYDDGYVFRLTKRFVEGGTAYTYAAIKATNDKWYTTGKMVYGVDWVDFATWCVSGKFPVAFTDLEPMVTLEEYNSKA
jgi:hypothetical protein